VPEFTPYAGDLADPLEPVPSGASQVTLANLKPGMSDLQRVASLWDSGDPGPISDLLTESQFSRSVDSEWQEASGDVVVVALLQFARPSNAAGWYDVASTTGFKASDVEDTGTISPLIPAGRYARTSTYLLIGLAVAGEFVIFVELGTQKAEVDLGRFEQVAVAQYQRLPGAVTSVP
jgi:hypothetical protein